jgi:hypothetical protein
VAFVDNLDAPLRAFAAAFKFGLPLFHAALPFLASLQFLL